MEVNEKGIRENGGSGGAKKLVVSGNVAKVFDLEDLLKASVEVLGKETFQTAHNAVPEMGIVIALKVAA